MLELERTYLAKTIPAGLASCPKREIVDVYIPKEAAHPSLRIRKNGDRCEMTKKEPQAGDASEQVEQTIVLTKAEFEALARIDGKMTRKVRHFYEHAGRTAEFDVFQGPLAGLVVVDFEFDSIGEKDAFRMPGFCLADVTHEEFIAGGMLCGKRYEDIAEDLGRFGYRKIFLP
ncbi:hypothetical protein JXB02_06755 [Candidatus Woesearchaeota archaeon]|nr:hypothetical protein [Candidatus Woesearchaeota archaeon]